MSAIGILGGMGPQASAKLYELIIKGTQEYTPAALDDYPEIVLLNVPVPNFISNKNELPKAKQMLIERTKLLEKAGCTVNGIACNTAHILLPELQAVTKVPFLSIPRLVAEQAKTAGYKRVGLLATPTTLSSTLYDEALADIAKIVRPQRDFSRQIESYIYKQLSGTLNKNEQQTFKQAVNKFRQINKLDTVILGCTELPLVYGESLNNDTIIDTLQLLATSLLDCYFNT
ncbi:aspartate/glutamate racemase family protein [Candidatus Saccharibacteria bacterium]|nr:MAG: aspartate/glutamate racemase family protein [Candidatus Saccharibacteria bacterium]